MKKNCIVTAGKGGFHEATRLQTELSSPLLTEESLPARIHLLDASSPVPNCRASEVLVALWALFGFGRECHTDISVSGTVTEYRYGLPEGLDLSPWKDFYREIHVDPDFLERKPQFAPMRALAASGQIATIRKGRIQQGINILSPYLGNPQGTLVVNDLVANLENTVLRSLHDAEDLSQHGKAIGRFACPLCSTDTPAYHVLRHSATGYAVTPLRSERAMRCRAAKVFLSQVNGDTLVSDLVNATGFVLNGNAAFRAINLTSDAGTGFLMRDYSESRQAIRTGFSLWKGRFGVTTRIYVLREDGSDADSDDLISALVAQPGSYADLLSSVPLISSGDVVTIHL